MSTSPDTAFLSVRVPTELRSRLKSAAAKRKTSVQQLMREAIEGLLARAEAEPPRLAEVVATLRQRQDELRRRGVEHLYVFGSVARGDARVDSDIDLAIDVDPASRFSIVTLASTAQDLEDWLQRSVDLGQRDALRAPLRAEFERDAVQAF